MRISKSLQKRIDKAVSEKINIVSYNPQWPKKFNEEAEFLKNKFPTIIKHIEHIGSTAVPNLSAKPIIDILIEVSSLKDVKKNIFPILTSLGYDYFWRCEIDKPPRYAWFIKRDSDGNRTHHLHMVKRSSNLWKRLYFRDYLKKYPKVAKEYEKLKLQLVDKYPSDREKYTKAKTEFILFITKKAKKYYQTIKNPWIRGESNP